MTTIDDITPCTVRRINGVPCPTSLAAQIEAGDVYFSPGSVWTPAVGGCVLLAVLKSIAPSTPLKTVLERADAIFQGHPTPSGKVGVGSLHSLRGLKPRIDPFTTDPKLRAMLSGPVRKKPSNAAVRIAALTDPQLKTCQNRFHGFRTEKAAVWVRVAMCTPCWADYRFVRPGPGHQFYAAVRIRRYAPAWDRMASLFKATAEAYCGYIAVCKAQTDTFRATADLPTEVLEYVGLQAMLYPWALLYASRTYTAVRLLHLSRPGIAQSRVSREPLRATPESIRWWRAVEERGWADRPASVVVRASVWGAPVAIATADHVVAWTSETLFSAAALSVLAAVAGIQPDISCTIAVTIVAGSELPRTLPRARQTTPGNVTMTISGAHAVSWRYVWRALSKAKDVNDALGRGKVHVTLNLTGNPLAGVPAHPAHPAWDAVVQAAPGDLIPAPTSAFFQWALGAAAVAIGPDVCAASMYPATSHAVDDMLKCAASGFPAVDDTAAVSAARLMHPSAPQSRGAI